ncbi:MAG: hypothetical protein HYS18_17495 [Burkholderiales bacterium]|nr:hypothetical protein [Burkholderiales bacterium]
MTENNKPGQKSLQQVADEVRDAMIHYIASNTAEEDVRREEERDARVRAALKELAHQGKLPPRKSKKEASRNSWTRLGPAPATLLCVMLVMVLAAFGALVPIGRPGRTLDFDQTVSMMLGAAVLATWAAAVGVNAWRLSRFEGDATVLVPPLSPGVFDFLFSAPLVVTVPVAAGVLPALVRGGHVEPTAIIAAFISVGLLALREIDSTAYVRDGFAHLRVGWLWVRHRSVPAAHVTGIRVERDSYQGAPSFVVKFEFPGVPRSSRFSSITTRFRSEEEANAEANRWRKAMGQV